MSSLGRSLGSIARGALGTQDRRVVVTGLGMVTPLAAGVSGTWEAVTAGKCGIRRLAPEDFEGGAADLDLVSVPIAGMVPKGKGDGQLDLEMFSDRGRLPPFIAYALAAAEEALADASWRPVGDDERLRTGVAIGSGMGHLPDIIKAGQLVHSGKARKVSPFFIPNILINLAAGHVSMRHGLAGPSHAASTACASGAHSIGDGFKMVRAGEADVVVAGGTEACVDPVAVAGFARMRALSTARLDAPAESSRPFDADRDGFVMGEGAGLVVLEEYEHAIRRGAKIYAEVRGFGMASDAFHIAQPPPDGRGAAAAMRASLQQSGLEKDDIGYVNAHATSTPHGDRAEVAAIVDVFGEHATSGALAVSSTKGAMGHLLGAAGAVEAIFAILALHTQTAPPTLNLHQPDVGHKGLNLVPQRVQRLPDLRAVMSNSFGFGGTNTCLTFASVALVGTAEE